MPGAERLAAVGVDGAPGGWLAVACWGREPEAKPAGRRTELLFFSDIAGLGSWLGDRAAPGEAPVAIDIPIGLPETVGFRSCDREARDRLSGQRKSSVFPVPPRSLLACATEPDDGKPPKAGVVFERARKVVAEEQDRLDRKSAEDGSDAEVLHRLNRQTAGILPKIAEVDAYLRVRPPGEPDRNSWMFEVHPELCFIAMAGGAPLPPKGSARGQLLRLDAVCQHFPDVKEQILNWAESDRRHLSDIFDAYAACWTATRYAATDGAAPARRSETNPPVEVLGECKPGTSPSEEASGLPMRVVL